MSQCIPSTNPLNHLSRNLGAVEVLSIEEKNQQGKQKKIFDSKIMLGNRKPEVNVTICRHTSGFFFLCSGNSVYIFKVMQGLLLFVVREQLDTKRNYLLANWNKCTAKERFRATSGYHL